MSNGVAAEPVLEGKGSSSHVQPWPAPVSIPKSAHPSERMLSGESEQTGSLRGGTDARLGKYNGCGSSGGEGAAHEVKFSSSSGATAVELICCRLFQFRRGQEQVTSSRFATKLQHSLQEKVENMLFNKAPESSSVCVCARW